MNDIIIMPSFALEPNRLCNYNQVFRSKSNNTWQSVTAKKIIKPKKLIQLDLFQKTKINEFKTEKKDTEFIKIESKNKIKRKFHNFTLSKGAIRTLKRRINWLYYLSKQRSIVTYTNKNIYNFKACFLTLTLPSVQQQPTSYITKYLFNQLLTELRTRVKMKNYVWRLEFQENGNVHYHLITDIYVDYFFVLKIWNRILKKANYIQPYTEKFSKLSLSQYNKLTNSNNKTDFKKVAKRYAKGCKTKWSNPNTVDLKSVTNGKKLQFYLSKYFAKQNEKKMKSNKLDNEDNSASMRLWYCSSNLSKLKSISNFTEAVEYDLFYLISKIKGVKIRLFKYCRVTSFNLKNASVNIIVFINKLLFNYAKKQGYFG